MNRTVQFAEALKLGVAAPACLVVLAGLGQAGSDRGEAGADLPATVEQDAAWPGAGAVALDDGDAVGQEGGQGCSRGRKTR